MQYLKFFFLIILDIIFSGGTSFFILAKMLNDVSGSSSCGTGSIGDAIGSIILSVVIFVILIVIYGFIFYWLLFTVI